MLQDGLVHFTRKKDFHMEILNKHLKTLAKKLNLRHKQLIQTEISHTSIVVYCILLQNGLRTIKSMF